MVWRCRNRRRQGVDGGSPTNLSAPAGSEPTNLMAGQVVVQVGLLVETVVGLWIGARLLVDSVVRLGGKLFSVL